MEPTRGWCPEAGGGMRGAGGAMVAQTDTRGSQAETRTIRCPCLGPRLLPPGRRPRTDPDPGAPAGGELGGLRPHWSPCRSPSSLQQDGRPKLHEVKQRMEQTVLILDMHCRFIVCDVSQCQTIPAVIVHVLICLICCDFSNSYLYSYVSICFMDKN